MKALDTNILARFLTGDDKQQTKAVYKLFKNTESAKKELFVPILVVLELIWVLESVYNIARSDILDSIKEMLMMPILKFEALPVLQQFILSARENKYDLSDLLIANNAKNSGCEKTLTFDKKTSKFDLFELVKA